MRNDIRLYTKLNGELVSHFILREFENSQGLCIVHPSLLLSLEQTRADLCALYHEDISLIITCALRTDEDNARLAKTLGWTDEGGAVARDSKHLPKYGGIAVDMVALDKRTGKRIRQNTLGMIARRYFDYVKDDYADGHVHADNRAKGK